MRTFRVAVVGASPCTGCTAACCRRTVSDFAVLLQTEHERRRFGPWSVTLPVADEAGVLRHERVITYRDDGRCPFLGDDDRCTIYEDRPEACRAFECTRHFGHRGPGSDGFFLRRNLDVRRLLETF
ncbi:MAG: YkgJ family cysteine cluster protein [Phycisphaerae bacterium]